MSVTREQLIEHIEAQHRVIDIMLAMLITRDPKFFPTHQPFWPTIAHTKLLLREAKDDSGGGYEH